MSNIAFLDDLVKKKLPAIVPGFAEQVISRGDDPLPDIATPQRPVSDLLSPEMLASMRGENKKPSLWGKFGDIAAGALQGYQSVADEQPRSLPVQDIQLRPLEWTPYYANPYERKKTAKRGGKFYPGDEVIVGEGSGPEMLKVEDDGVRVIPNPADLPEIGTPVDRLHPGMTPEEKYRQLPPITASPAAPSVELPAIAPPDVPPPSMPANLPTIGGPVDPLDAKLAAATDEYNKIGRNPDPKHKHSKWSRIAAAVEGWMKGGLLGDIQAARNPHHFEDQTVVQDRERLLPQIGALTKMRDANLRAQKDRTQIRDIGEDNAARDRRNADMREAAIAKNLTTGLKNFTDRIWRGQKYFKPAAASEFDKLQLAKFGMKPEDIGEFDFRDPKTKTVNGETFQWNANDQAYTPSDLPKDGSKEIVEYKVTDPDGVPHTFKTTSDRAAGFLTSIKAAGMQIEAAASRQASQQQFTAGQNEEARKVARERIALSREQLTLAQQKFESAEGQAKVDAENDIKRIKASQIRLKAYLKNNPLISDDKDLLNDIEDLDQ